MLQLIQTPAEILDDSALYLRIYVLGLPFLFFYNVSNGIFSALGDSRTPFLFLAVSSTLNVGVDILFVAVFGMGVAGVAWATFLCQGASCICALFVVFGRLRGMQIREKSERFSWPIFEKILTIAVPSTIQQSLISVGNIILQSVINGFGAGVIAGYAAGVKLNNLVITSFTTLANGVSNYTAQNIGAQKMDRVRQGFGAGLKMVWTLSVPLCLLYLFGSRILLGFFMKEAAGTAMSTGIIYLRILAPFYFVVSAKLISDGILRGSGMMKEFMIGTFADLLLRVVIAIVLARTVLGSTGIWCAWPIGWTISTAISIFFYRRGAWFDTRE